MIRVIAFDGDDTLWHNETIFALTQSRFREMLGKYVDDEELDRQLLETERRNLGVFGYGVKGFILSTIETAIQVSGGGITANEIESIIAQGKAMLEHPVELLEGVRDVIEDLRPVYRLMLITKGDLFDQESKIARSGLADLFWRVEILSEKDPENYRRILRRNRIPADSFLMVGNSLRSDILPVISLGGWAVHVPYHLTWAHEQVELTEPVPERMASLDTIACLPPLLEAWPQPYQNVSASP